MSKTRVVRISDAQIKQFMTDDSVSQLRDSRHSTLRFRFGVKGRGSWYLVLHRNAKTEWKKIGNFPAVRTSSVLKHLPDLLTQYSLIPHTAVQLSEWELVSDLLGWYVERVELNRSMSAKRKASIRSVVKVHLLPKLGELLIEDLDHALLDSELVWPLQCDYELSTVRLILSVLKKAFKQARTLKLIPFNPIAEVKFSDFTDAQIIPKSCAIQSNGLPRVITLLNKAPETERVFVLMMLLHGTRIGETRLAKWSHIDFENKTWFIPKGNTKTKVDLVLPLTDTALTLLTKFKGNQQGFIFKINDHSGFSEVAANEVVQRVSAREWRAHDLRKFARTTWMDLGVDYLVGEMLLNHVLNKMDKTYIHTHANNLMRQALVIYHNWLCEQGITELLNQKAVGWV
ncbi:tyrosine-type recombinase/integrase [Psychromonas sp. 14N.309.X.WAT.B.A12]|uniref:tyrosine-type recombinase/integrase n=1 Tax=Psychromonas sp. 14N.309.X.WAT.B.A12 TaxID=2998322 RepID=UPI0025B1BE21|nr:tyrosine-type recombinase/integrase [Psychromonas sp. 14N.309.X.WAT.B.A12]MDN2661826.1 tyrosine-type recombinase/integrase [Psychromonas sp. 14N.309.X.WAT.B.A12]